MNIAEYISSGIIEQYVLGLASEAEALEVEQMAAQHAEVRQAIDAYESSLEQYAMAHAVAPRKELKNRVLEAISKQQAVAQMHGGIRSEGITVMPARSIRLYKLIAVAASILLLISLSLNGIYIFKYNQTKGNYEVLLASQQQMAANNQTLGARMEGIENDLQLLMNPMVKPVVMKGVAAHPGMMATVYWNPENRSAYFGPTNLPKAPQGKAYQLWAIIDGKPVDMGMYQPSGQEALQQMKQAAPGTVQAFAVTLEKEGGSPVPTLNQMMVTGNI